MTDEVSTHPPAASPTLRTGAADFIGPAPERSRRRSPSGYLLISIAGWVLLGAGIMIVSIDVQPNEVILATTPAYVLMGFLLSMLLPFVYNGLGVGPTSFARALSISVVASYVAGALWTIAFYFYRQFGAPIIVDMLGGPSSLPRERAWWAADGGVINALPLFALSLVRLGLQYNTALREQREQALRAESAARDAQLRMLAYQLNPHFLFNTLNSIRALINEDRRRARDMVTALSDYLRYALVERPLHVALLEEEVASVRGYLAIEKVRFEERLDAHMDIDPAALQCEVPAFLLNPLVENAVKHGAAAVAGAPLVLRVEARLMPPKRLRIVVENTGRLTYGEERLTPAARDEDNRVPGGVGLANVRARLAALHPDDHHIGIEETDGRVRVTVVLPAIIRGRGST